MEYAKKTVILKGEAQGIFTMQRSGATKYSLSWTSEPASGDLFVFDEDSFYRLPTKSGILPIDITQVCAIAIGENFSSNGQLRPFNWAKARGMIAAQSKKTREAIEKNAVSEPNAPNSHEAIFASANAVAGEALATEEEKGAETIKVEAQQADAPQQSAAESTTPEKIQPEPPQSQLEQDFMEKNTPEKDGSSEATHVEDSTANAAQQDKLSSPHENRMHMNDKEDIPSSQQTNTLNQCPMTELPIDVCPFMRDFPQSQWKRHEFPSARGKWHYLTGDLYQDGKIYATALALPGSPNVRPGGNGFNTYRIAGDGRGYWIRITKI